MLTVLQNQTFPIGPSVEARDTGWIISGSVATHYPCNPGTMKSIGSQGLVVGKTYVVSYDVFDLFSGTVKVLLGTTSGTSRSANGSYTQTLLCATKAEISFYSDGYLSIDNLKFYELVEDTDNSITVAFYDDDGKNQKKWATTYSYSPQLMINFGTLFFAIKDGVLWQQNVNPIRNNFFGVQYQSKVQIYANIHPTTVKIFYTIRVEANTPWFCPNDGDISILPIKGQSTGMASRLKMKNFRNYKGSFYADFMRNMLDSRPQFATPQQALYKGGELMGRFMSIMLSNPDTDEAVLFEVDIKSSPTAITY